jgi:hypothetical protein
MSNVKVSRLGETSSASIRLIADWCVPARRARRDWLSW